MRHTAFVEFVAQLKQLTPEQRKQLVVRSIKTNTY